MPFPLNSDALKVQLFHREIPPSQGSLLPGRGGERRRRGLAASSERRRARRQHRVRKKWRDALCAGPQIDFYFSAEKTRPSLPKPTSPPLRPSPFVACETPRRARPPLLLPPVATLTTTLKNDETCLSLLPPTAAVSTIPSFDRAPSSRRQTAAPLSTDRAPCLMRGPCSCSIAARAEAEEDSSSFVSSA